MEGNCDAAVTRVLQNVAHLQHMHLFIGEPTSRQRSVAVDRRRYCSPVESKDLHPDQAAALQAIVSRHLRFLNRLCKRLDELGFPPSDALATSAHTARAAVQDLHVRCHYTSCRHGVARDPK